MLCQIEDVRSRYGREIASKKLKDDNRSKEKLPTGECYIKYPAILPSAVTALVSVCSLFMHALQHKSLLLLSVTFIAVATCVPQTLKFL